MGFGGIDLGGQFGHAGTRYGDLGDGDFADLQKALSAGYGTDVATLTGGAAIRVQSLDSTLYAVTQGQQHFKLWNALTKTKAKATVDEWVRSTTLGGYPGSAFNSELGTITERTGALERKTGLVKYLMTRRSVSFVQLQQQTIAQSEALEQVKGTLELLTSIEHSSFYGDAAVVPESFDGLKKILLANGAAVIDARGGPVDPTVIIDMQAQVTGMSQNSSFGGFGQLTDMFNSHAVQVDLDSELEPAYRVAMDNNPTSIQFGAKVLGISTTWGNINCHADPFVRESWKIHSLVHGGATSVNPTPPVSAAAALVSDTTAANLWGATHLGAYYWAVTSVNKFGVSTVVKSSQVTVVAANRVDITITRSGAADETGYYVFRTAKGGGNADADFRYIGQIAVAGATTVYQDLNADIPGCSDIFLLNLGGAMGGPEAVSWRQLLPMTKFALYPTDKPEVPWAQMIFGFLRVAKPEHCALYRNILPRRAVFRPF